VFAKNHHPVFINRIMPEEQKMTRTEQLEDAIRTITNQAGIEISGTIHLTPVSQDSNGVFIMDIMWPQGRRVCEQIKRYAKGFPSVTYSSCVALLPDVVDEIIAGAQRASAMDRFPSNSCNRPGKE
jgi:hypothetical protein